MTTETNITATAPSAPRKRTRTAELLPVAPVPPPPGEYDLVEDLVAATTATTTNELARVGQLAALRDRHRVALADAEQDLAGYRQRCRETAEQHRVNPDFYISKEEVRIRETTIAAARGRLATVEGDLARLQPAIDAAAQAAVDQARAALEAHRATPRRARRWSRRSGSSSPPLPP